MLGLDLIDELIGKIFVVDVGGGKTFAARLISVVELHDVIRSYGSNLGQNPMDE